MRCSHPYIFREEERVSPGHTRGVCVCVQVVCVSVKVCVCVPQKQRRLVTYHITRGGVGRDMEVVECGDDGLMSLSVSPVEVADASVMETKNSGAWGMKKKKSTGGGAGAGMDGRAGKRKLQQQVMWQHQKKMMRPIDSTVAAAMLQGPQQSFLENTGVGEARRLDSFQASTRRVYDAAMMSTTNGNAEKSARANYYHGGTTTTPVATPNAATPSEASGMGYARHNQQQQQRQEHLGEANDDTSSSPPCDVLLEVPQLCRAQRCQHVLDRCMVRSTLIDVCVENVVTVEDEGPALLECRIVGGRLHKLVVLRRIRECLECVLLYCIRRCLVEERRTQTALELEAIMQLPIRIEDEQFRREWNCG